MRPFRVPLECDLSPAAAIPWLRGEERPFALAGEWLGGLSLLGSAPARVLRADEDPFAALDMPPALSGAPDSEIYSDSHSHFGSGQRSGSGSGAVRVGGGWVGWLGYGLGARVEQLPPSPPAPVPRPDFSLAFYDHVLVHDGTQWWFEALWSPEREAVLRDRLALWRQRLRTIPVARDGVDAALTPFRLAANGGAGHLEAVADCRQRIAAGELYEANLCVRLEARFAGDPLDLFARALPAAEPRFGAYVDGLVSLSPERFLRRAGRAVWTEPIKGTRPRVGGEAARLAAFRELAASEKDAAEHVMIVDLMRNDLGRVCRYGSVRAESPRVEPHAGVWHLVSTVSGTLRDRVGDGELLRASFPPGSVTGAPKVQAMKVIAALEATRREVYTGAIGIVSPVAGLDLSVAIRTFEVAGGSIWLGAGGAVVADSEPASELAEAFDKAVGPVAAIGGTLVRRRGEPGRRGGSAPPTLPPALPLPALPQRALLHGARPDPGLGVFETMLVEHGRPIGLERHLARLAASVRAVYGATLPTTLLAGAQAASAESADMPRARMRVLADPSGAVRISVSAAGPPPERAVELAPFALPGGLGAHKWRDRRLIESLGRVSLGAVPLLVDTDGAVLEAAYANVWIVEDDDLITPPADGRILPGTERAALLAANPFAREEAVDLRRLERADAVFLTSSISGRHPARLHAGLPRHDPAGLEVRR